VTNIFATVGGSGVVTEEKLQAISKVINNEDIKV